MLKVWFSTLVLGEDARKLGGAWLMLSPPLSLLSPSNPDDYLHPPWHLPQQQRHQDQLSMC